MVRGGVSISQGLEVDREAERIGISMIPPQF
jgi:hypothetical protein